MTSHSLLRQSDQYDYHITDARFRLRCTCGWEAAGWFDNDQSAFDVWSVHVNEATEGETQ